VASRADCSRFAHPKMKLFVFLIATALTSLPLCAQTAGLRGQVTDETGAVRAWRQSHRQRTIRHGRKRPLRVAMDHIRLPVWAPVPIWCARPAPDLTQTQPVKIV